MQLWQVNASASHSEASGKEEGADSPTYVPGQRTDISFLDPINHADTPPAAVQLGTAELIWRLEEERRRRTGLLACSSGLTFQRMSGPAGTAVPTYSYNQGADVLGAA